MRRMLMALAPIVVIFWTLRATPVTRTCGSPAGGASARWSVDTVARHLQVPWAIAPISDGRVFFTERVGRLGVLDSAGAVPRKLAEFQVATSSDPNFATGLLGLTVDPEFPRLPYLYVYYTYQQGSDLANRLVRLRVSDSAAVVDRVLLDSIPGSSFQNGGRIHFGPDGRLYVPTGGGSGGPQLLSGIADTLRARREAGRDLGAQDPISVVGKILRLDRDGGVPPDNPYPGSPIFSLGHRNPQGLAWHPRTGALYNTEHGDPGGWDELNLVRPGGNYGWPIFKGNTISFKMRSSMFEGLRQTNDRPVAVYTPSIGPSGIAFYSGRLFPQWTNDLFVASLAQEQLRRIVLSADGRRVACEQAMFPSVYGRIRSVVEAPDGSVYFSTSNHDQSGVPHQDDDMILHIVAR